MILLALAIDPIHWCSNNRLDLDIQFLNWNCVHFQEQKKDKEKTNKLKIFNNLSVNFMALAGIHLEHLMARLDKATVWTIDIFVQRIFPFVFSQLNRKQNKKWLNADKCSVLLCRWRQTIFDRLSLGIENRVSDLRVSYFAYFFETMAHHKRKFTFNRFFEDRNLIALRFVCVFYFS